MKTRKTISNKQDTWIANNKQNLRDLYDGYIVD